MTTQTRQRTLTAANVARTLTAAIIPQLGSNKLNKMGQGNPYVRDNGTEIHIFNLNAFATEADRVEAIELWKKGARLEKSGDIDGAQESLREALNKQMSFSVLAENAPDFQGAHEITCRVVMVKNDAGKDVVGINNPAPVAIKTNAVATTGGFVLEEEAAPPVETASEKRARIKAEKAKVK